jgi:hypothetical protein
VARTGLRMMPTFPLLPLKFRRADFLRYGFKAGLSDGAFPSMARSSPRAVCIRPSCPSLACRVPRTEPRDRARLDTSVRAVPPLYPRGPRSGPGSSVSVHPHLIDPIRPTRKHSSTSPLAAYTRCLRCASAHELRRLGDPRVVPCFRWQLCVGMSSSGIPGSSLAACAQYLHQ